MRIALVVLLLGISPVPVRAQRPVDDVVRRLASLDTFSMAAAFLERDHDRLVRELVTLTEIPAPPFKEHARAQAFLSLLREHGLSDVEKDAEGNVMGVRPGAGAGPMLVVSAHLDTVFPEGTDVTVRREGTRLMAPGIGDDSRGLALMLSLIRAMDAGGVRTQRDVLFVGTVGEEGDGDLRGVKYLFRQGRYKDRIGQFISLDFFATTEWPIINGALGVKRYRVTFKGPGGHSFNAFGLVNPGLAMAGAMARLGRLSVPDKPKTTFNVGVVGGGTSVNSIPIEMYMDVDLRSEAPSELARLEQALRVSVREAIDEENQTRSTATGSVEADFRLTGDRPPGQVSASSEMVQRAAAAAAQFGFAPTFSFQSTDANIPISMGIPALTIPRGVGGNSHALTEWTDVEPVTSTRIAKTVLLTIIAVASVP
jgi:acetylornithine deacetylase/succinyl-diaminopimelate desuccinylase-like protein